MRPASFVGWSWLVWYLSWLVAATWQERAVSRPGVRAEIVYRTLTIVGALMLFGFLDRVTHGETPLWLLSDAVAWVVAVVVLAGFAFAWWARLHIGRLWSSSITRKADHHVVDTGPYRIVRHPIYTGISLSTLATATVRGTTEAWIGGALLILGFYVKARQEERFLREGLGPAYDNYAARTGMLIPFAVRRSR